MSGNAVFIDPMFRAINYAEAGLWGVISVGFLISAWRNKSARGVKLVAAGAFVAFGFSDVVETTTGAWWRPWWLLAWKAACIAAFLALFVYYVLYLRPRRGSPR